MLPLLAAGCGLLEHTSLGQQLTTGMGVAAQQLCSLVVVSELEPQRARDWYVDPLLREGASFTRLQLDRASGTATARIFGIVGQYAIHREGYGCTLVQDDDRGLERVARAREAPRPMALDLAHRDAFFDASKLDAALDEAFRQDSHDPPANTLAVVVLHDGHLVAERYADGITAETRLPGWSMTKSVTATIVGVLAFQGRVDVHAPRAIREWRDSSDPRSRITLDHLLRMTSGLAVTEESDRGDGTDPNSIMLYHEPDAAHFAATRSLQYEVGAHFEYMSGNYVLAARAAQEAIGGGLQDAREFLQANRASHMLATARDWARFGQLYVAGGVAGGRRILAPEWLRYVTEPTPQSNSNARAGVFWEPGRSAYGAGFWLFGPDEVSGLPPDAFDANGFQGQYLHIVPSEKLVVVRLGATNFRHYDHNRLPREVFGALRHASRRLARSAARSRM